MNIFRKRILSTALVALFVTYYTCTVLFTHVHYANGMWISHMHAGMPKGHDHSGSDVSFQAIYSAFIAIEAQTPSFTIQSLSRLHHYSEASIAFHLQKMHLKTLSLRAPPAASLLF